MREFPSGTAGIGHDWLPIRGMMEKEHGVGKASPSGRADLGRSEQSWYIEPKGNPNLCRQLYLLTSDLTVSAAETFPLMIGPCGVTQIGQPPNPVRHLHWSSPCPATSSYLLSNEVYRDASGVAFETTGIPPPNLMVFGLLTPPHWKLAIGAQWIACLPCWGHPKPSQSLPVCQATKASKSFEDLGLQPHAPQAATNITSTRYQTRMRFRSIWPRAWLARDVSPSSRHRRSFSLSASLNSSAIRPGLTHANKRIVTASGSSRSSNAIRDGCSSCSASKWSVKVYSTAWSFVGSVVAAWCFWF